MSLAARYHGNHASSPGGKKKLQRKTEEVLNVPCMSLAARYHGNHSSSPEEKTKNMTMSYFKSKSVEKKSSYFWI